GIRAFHVTGVQTCALPILGWLIEHGVERSHHRNLQTMQQRQDEYAVLPAENSKFVLDNTYIHLGLVNELSRLEVRAMVVLVDDKFHFRRIHISTAGIIDGDDKIA